MGDLQTVRDARQAERRDGNADERRADAPRGGAVAQVIIHVRLHVVAVAEEVLEQPAWLLLRCTALHAAGAFRAAGAEQMRQQPARLRAMRLADGRGCVSSCHLVVL